MDKYVFKTKFIDEEEKFRATLLCNGVLFQTEEFDGHHEMMNWVSERMSELLLCGENWEFTIKQ